MYAEGKLDATSSDAQEVKFKPSSSINDKVSLWLVASTPPACRVQAAAESDVL
jgi:hypothetical protein